MSAGKQTHALSALWARNRELSGFASEHVRTSALAGLAVAWLFTGASEGDISKLATASDGLLVAAGFFAASLSMDILHYYVGALVFQRVARAAELAGKVADDAVEVRPWVPRVPRFFYNAMDFLLFAGYALLACEFASAVGD